MARDHQSFWFELSGKLGPPVFAATLVGCLLSGRLALAHLVLMAAGLALIALGHWGEHHR